MTKNSFRFQAPRFKFRVVVTAVELKQLEQAVPDFYAGSCLTRRTADSSSRNGVSYSSACTTKRFPSPRCASAIQIVRPLESIAETQPQLHPAFLEIVRDYFPVLHLMSSAAPFRGTACLSYPIFQRGAALSF